MENPTPENLLPQEIQELMYALTDKAIDQAKTIEIVLKLLELHNKQFVDTENLLVYMDQRIKELNKRFDDFEKDLENRSF